MTDCADLQTRDWCPTSTDDVLPGLLGLLPRGRAWQSADVPGTKSNSFWRSFASVLGFTNERICALLAEMNCSTILETAPEWMADYGLPDECDPYGDNLCLKVVAVGDPRCAEYVTVAARSGFVISCEDTSDTPIPVVGCMMVGCTPLGPTPEPFVGSNLGSEVLYACDYGKAIAHPEPEYWEDDQHKSTCRVPGSTLGVSQIGPGCCFTVGYFEFPPEPQPTNIAALCASEQRVFFYDCVGSPAINTLTLPCDSTGKFFAYTGHAYHFKITIHLDDTAALQAAMNIPTLTTEWSQAGCFQVGCNQLAGPSFQAAICALDLIKPAHTVIRYEVVQ